MGKHLKGDTLASIWDSDTWDNDTTNVTQHSIALAFSFKGLSSYYRHRTERPKNHPKVSAHLYKFQYLLNGFP